MKNEREARARTVRFIRGMAIAIAVLIFVLSGHVWNTDKVHPPTVYAFDFMILLLTIFIVAVLMDDASERRKNIYTIVLIIVAGIMTAFVIS